MKNIIAITLLSLLVLSGCKEDSVPFPTLLSAKETTITKDAQTITIPIETTKSIVEVTADAASAEWCQFDVQGTNIVATVSANAKIIRTANFTIKGEDRVATTKLHQEGLMVLHNKANWEVVGFCDEIASDGGGAKAILEDKHDTFWHNNWSNGNDKLPHWIIIDMKEELDVDMVRLGWRKSGSSYYYNNKVTDVYIGNSPEYTDMTNKVGSLTTLPVGTSHASKDHLPFHDVDLKPAKGRYLMLEVTESNSGQTSIIAFVQAYKAQR